MEDPTCDTGSHTGGTIKDCWLGKLSGSCTLDQQALYITTDHIWALARSPLMGKHAVLVWDRIFEGGEGKKRGGAGKDWEWDILRGLGRIFGGPRAVEPVGKVGKEGGVRARKLLAASVKNR